MGFSQKTYLPASTERRTKSTCVSVGEQTYTASTPGKSMASSNSEATWHPAISATSFARSLSCSNTQRRRARGFLTIFVACSCPIRPAPINAIPNGALLIKTISLKAVVLFKPNFLSSLSRRCIAGGDQFQNVASAGRGEFDGSRTDCGCDETLHFTAEVI